MSPVATGDGFSNWEEYRGVICRGEHRRLNPGAADLFLGVVNAPSTSYPAADWLRLVRSLATREHELAEAEYGQVNGSATKRQVQLDGSYCPDPGEPDATLWPWVEYQLLAQVNLTPASPLSDYGSTTVHVPCADGRDPSKPPRSALNCRSGDAVCLVSVPAHQATTPPQVLSPMTPPPTVQPTDPLDVPAIQHTIAHEVGHVLGMTHYCHDCNATPSSCGIGIGPSAGLCDPPNNCTARPPCTLTTIPGCPTSVMVSAFMWALPCCTTLTCPPGPWWTNLPVGYEQIDVDAIAIK